MKSLHKKITGNANPWACRKEIKRHAPGRSRLAEDAKQVVEGELSAQEVPLDQDLGYQHREYLEQALEEAKNRYSYIREGYPTPLAERLGSRFLEPLDLPDVVGQYPYNSKGEP